jgi:hypothetical protein
MNSDQLDYMRAVFFLLEETDVVRDAVEEWQDSWEPWGPFQKLDHFVEAWNSLAPRKSAFSDVGFFVMWDSVKHLFPDSLDKAIREYPPGAGDSAISVMSSMLRDDDFEGFSLALEDYLRAEVDDGEELVSSALSKLAEWWDQDREKTLEAVWAVVSELDLSSPLSNAD